MSVKWFDSTERSVLMDEETQKVVGQAVHEGMHWFSYDNDREMHDGSGARFLGRFPFLQQAKAVVEQLVA